MTNYRYALPIVLAHAVSVTAYIDDSMMRKYSTSYAPTKWSPQSGSFTPKIQPQGPSRPRTRVVPITPRVKEAVTPPTPVDIGEIIRAEYDAWTFRYGKTKNDERFGIFRSNFLTQMEWNRKSGQFYLLNEFGDMTMEEYTAAISKPRCAAASKFDDKDLKTIEPSSTIVSNLDIKVVDAILDQVIDDDVVSLEKIDIDEVALMQGDSKWSQYSFAMDFGEVDDIVASLAEDEDNGESIADSPLVEKSQLQKSLEDAPIAQNPRIISLGRAEAASPEIQTWRTTQNKNKPSKSFNPKSAFAVTMASLFASVAPMGSLIGKKKNTLE